LTTGGTGGQLSRQHSRQAAAKQPDQNMSRLMDINCAFGALTLFHGNNLHFA